MQDDNRLVFTVAWEVAEGSGDVAADIIGRFIPEARNEPGLEVLTVNRCATNPSQFLFYEVFRDKAAFDTHQQTPHIKALILREALPLLKSRERVQYTPL